MPNDLAPKTAVFTYQGMKLLYKEGITEQWIGKLTEDIGYNLWHLCAPASATAIASNPTPAVDDHGGMIWIHQALNGTTEVTLDSAVNWLDRDIAFFGLVGTTGQSQAAATLGPFFSLRADHSNKTNSAAEFGNRVELASGAQAPAFGMVYTKAGVASLAGILDMILNTRTTGGTEGNVWINAKSDGTLIARLSTGTSGFIRGWIFRGPKYGHRDD